MADFTVLDDDRYIWDTELADFMPKRAFDAHAHLFDLSFYSETDAAKMPFFARLQRLTAADTRAHFAALFPEREFHFLFMGNPRKHCDMDGLHGYIAAEVATDPGSIGLMLALPEWTPKEIERTLDRHGFRGFKPYMCFSTNPDSAQSTILEMLPIHYWEIAQERELIVLLHMGRHQALADPVNQRQIQELAARFPRVRFQLAHCARCFTPQIAEEGLPRVAQLPNVFVDTSAVCETEVFNILFDVWPRERILFGTDMPVGILRGKYVAFGRGWFGVYERHKEVFNASHVPYGPTFIAYENLRAMRAAARRHRWGKAELEDIFLNNAVRLLGLNDGKAG